ncbi:hypothetical protein BHE97_16570 [Aeromicrobium sp. PE09-221]|uniref:hypothetical protein n=1 Tax=Aeromicrobium sp. PE09-221 TaxID=1898043 RepID=UPI000B3E7044|nr:hypothetical protein [Aeromicrobium sp. PE09-221]OUZ07560.1 hypothetical protein BHE97_16570 [Aeromicrobium sp. PE09-221]
MRPLRPLLGATSIVLVAACSSSPVDDAGQQHGHGHVEGAVEEAEAQYRLVVADGESASVIDLLDATSTTFDLPADSLQTDGRFVYGQRDGSVTVVDAGTWTWPHGDHNHYYRQDAALLGDVELDAGTIIGAFGSDTLAVGEDGAVTVIDRDALEDGELSTSTGEDIDGSCEDPAGAVHTGEQLVLACAAGALIVEDDTTELVEYPGEGRAHDVRQRPRATELAAVIDDSVAVLDLNDRTWTTFESPSPLTAVALGADLGVLVLGEDGTLRHYSLTGEQLAERPLIEHPDPENPPAIVADSSRAYVNDSEASVVHEIDYADGLRIARGIQTGDVAPLHLVETGS